MDGGMPCPCDSGKTYALCCLPLLEKGMVADSCESLMRSRYSAYVLKKEAYLLSTWDETTRPQSLNLDEEKGHWLGLQIKHSEQVDKTHGIVEFVARYKLNGKAQRLHERSRFINTNGSWYYIDGEFLE